MKYKDIVVAILYELQPIRSKDAIILSTWIYKNLCQIVEGCRTLFIWTKENLLALPMLISQKMAIITIVWLAIFYLFNFVGFGSLYFMLSIFVAIFSNLGKRLPGELSAYSVFNAKFQKLLGTLTADQIDKQLRHAVEDDDDWHEVGQDGRAPPARPNLQHRKVSGKKSRRGYEKKMLRRQLGQGGHGNHTDLNDDGFQIMEFEFSDEDE